MIKSSHFAAIVVLLILLPAVIWAEPRFSLDHVADRFPSEDFETEITFWKKVFTEYGSRDVIFHDRDDLRLIYHRVEFEREIGNDPREAKRQQDFLKAEQKKLEAGFDEIRRLGPDSNRLSPEQRQILAPILAAGYKVDSTLLRRLKDNLRYQRGVRDKFRESLIRSGLYMDRIRKILNSHGLPEELSVMPHVESSFDYNAYSSAGAAGIWQFTRGTGRAFLTIGRYVDERLDPIKATQAAALLLKSNYQAFESWPITITSYNHGKNGMLRAVSLHGKNFRQIVDRYESKYFGFASKNFYAEFLAALEVSTNYKEYFGELQIEQPFVFDTVNLQRTYDISYFTTVPGLSEEVLISFNPHIRSFTSSRYRIVPAGTVVRIPKGKGAELKTALASAAPASASLLVAADGSTRYRVQTGDTLGDIASQLSTTTSFLKQLNGIDDANRIYPGQVLLITQGSGPSSLSNSQGASVRDSGTEPSPPGTYAVRRGDNLSSIASRFNTTVAELKRSNGISDANHIQPGMLLTVSGSGTRRTPQTYVVQSGDTLARIAQRFNTSVTELRNANGIQDPHLIRNGQEILIP